MTTSRRWQGWDMEAEWAPSKFGDLLSDPVRNGIYKKKEFHGRGVKIVNMGELFAYPRLFNVEMKRVELTDKEKQNFLLSNGDLLFARRSLTAEGAGKCSIVKEAFQETTFESSIIRARPNPKKADSDFLYYFFASPQGKYLVGTILRQVAVSGITGSDLRELVIPTPKLKIQKAIAHILGSLDDKIDLNRRMNATLEAMAQALFKSWFVDFDPVIDNALVAGHPIPEALQERAEARATLGDHHQPLPETIRQQFPNRFVCNEDMGWVPEGWKARTLAQLCDKITDGSHQSPKSVDQCTGLPMASSKDLTRSGIDFSSCRYISKQDFSELLNNGCAPDIGDVLIAKDGSRCGETCCLYSSNNSVVLLSSIAILKPKRPEYSTYINTLLSRTETIANLHENFVSGSAIPRIVLRDFKRYPIICPPESIFKLWYMNTVSYHKRTVELDRESKSLAALRDTLLPKLLSGQLRIPEAEQQGADML